MATLRALPSISTLLSQPLNFSSREADSGRRKLPLGRLSPHVKLSSRPRSPAVAIQGLRAEGVSCESGGRHGDEDSHEVAAVESVSVSGFAGFVQENARELAIASVVFALVCLPDEHALALGPGGPLMEEFWDNVRRYGFYFFTVVSGGLYSLAKPLLDLLKDPSTQILVIIAISGRRVIRKARILPAFHGVVSVVIWVVKLLQACRATVAPMVEWVQGFDLQLLREFLWEDLCERLRWHANCYWVWQEAETSEFLKSQQAVVDSAKALFMEGCCGSRVSERFKFESMQYAMRSGNCTTATPIRSRSKDSRRASMVSSIACNFAHGHGTPGKQANIPSAYCSSFLSYSTGDALVESCPAPHSSPTVEVVMNSGSSAGSLVSSQLLTIHPCKMIAPVRSSIYKIHVHLHLISYNISGYHSMGLNTIQQTCRIGNFNNSVF